ncbi:hypothetical protein HY991_01135 [Candidatus Micrarchaeota archaeon]|nr:hypothetical protein [Candidatus Micrarchaeota archaeon]
MRGRDMEAEVLKNTQFIYEVALARLELGALGADAEITNGFRIFNIKKPDSIKTLIDRLAYFKRVGSESTLYSKLITYNQTRSINQYLTHWFYPYKGKFHPQMIRALLNYSQVKPGDLVLDPYMGSGTACLEAQVLGIDSIGVDISPVCNLISKVKTQSVEVLDEIMDESSEIVNKSNGNSIANFGEKNGERLDDAIAKIKNEKVRNFFQVAKLISHSDESRRGRNFNTQFKNNVEKMLVSVKDYQRAIKKHGLKIGKTTIKQGDARELPLDGKSVDAIVTSPPYSIALDYVKNDAHALKALGEDVTKIRDGFIGVRGSNGTKLQLYDGDLKKTYDEMYRVLKPKKVCSIVIGNATFQGQEVKTVELTVDYCQSLGFQLEKNVEKIIFGLYNVMQKENILIFRKE